MRSRIAAKGRRLRPGPQVFRVLCCCLGVVRCVVLVLSSCLGFTLVAEPQPRSGAVVSDTCVKRLFVLCLSLCGHWVWV